jgi:Fic family protein
VYLPPEAKDVPRLMQELVEWVGVTRREGKLPVPLIAAIAHYQFATIHPYYDGNGRSARLLTTLILHRFGYGLKGIYSLEEYYARDLHGYYNALSVGPSHNYYGGRAEAAITPFLEYFLAGMRASFAAVRVRAEDAAERGGMDQSMLLRKLDPKKRRVLELFGKKGVVGSGDLSEALGLSMGTTRALCREWVKAGFLVVHDASRKNRLYRLGDEFERVVGG